MKVVLEFSPNAQKVLCKRYLRKGPDYSKCSFCGETHETSEEMLERASYGSEDFYNLLASLDFLPNSPTLFNAGIDAPGTSSGCFKFDVEDSMVGILEVGRKAGLVQKWGGGVGYCLSALRRRDALIRSTHGKACGPVAVLSFYHSIALLITQGGKREGAQMGILHCDHPDIEEFINCKKDNPQLLSTFNISVACTDGFMEKASQKGTKQSHLLGRMAENAHKVGDPGIFFIDTAEKANPTPHLGKLTGTNPCGEVPLLDNEPCNLGSINLSKFVKGYYIDSAQPGESHVVEKPCVDWDRLGEVVALSIDYLDETLTRNSFPDPIINEVALKTRKIGLGVMGWSDMLVLLRIPYDSQEAVDLASKIMDFIQKEATARSVELAVKLGRYPACLNGDYPDARRNATVTCIAPTGSVSILADCSSGIEPHYSLDYTKYMGDRTPLHFKVPILGFTPKTALDIDWKWHLKHQAAFQEHTDLAVSKTVNIPKNTTAETIREIFSTAWELKCKGVTVYRDGCRVVQAMETGAPKKAFPKRDYPALVHRFKVGDMKGYLHWGLQEDKTPGEIFITASKQGSTTDGLLDAVAILISIAIQSGVPLEEIVHKMRGRRFEPSGLTSNPKIPTASSILDYIARYAQMQFLGAPSSYNSGMECPDCGAPVISQEGCLVCSENCGWSRC